MSKLIIVLLLAGFIVSNDDASKYADKSYEELLLEYDAPQRKENQQKPGGVEVESMRWIHLNKSVGGRTYYNPDKVSVTKRLREEIIDRSNAYIECDQKIANLEIHPFDFPMPNDWLYDTFQDKGRMPWFFDTEVKEHWVLPNVYCNSKNILSALSWMRSHEDGGMHAKFKGKDPPFYGNESLEDHHRGGVFCNWNGWLYGPSKGKYTHWFDSAKDDELFTFIDVYCHENKVRFFAKHVASHNQRKSDQRYPFEPQDMKTDLVSTQTMELPVVGCDWTGWLFADMTDARWKHKGSNRYSYEKYYAIDTHAAGRSKKAWMNGRIMNPFCSRLEDKQTGVVTALRVYCFYSKENRCSDLTPTPSQ